MSSRSTALTAADALPTVLFLLTLLPFFFFHTSTAVQIQRLSPYSSKTYRFPLIPAYSKQQLAFRISTGLSGAPGSSVAAEQQHKRPSLNSFDHALSQEYESHTGEITRMYPFVRKSVARKKTNPFSFVGWQNGPTAAPPTTAASAPSDSSSAALTPAVSQLLQQQQQAAASQQAAALTAQQQAAIAAAQQQQAQQQAALTAALPAAEAEAAKEVAVASQQIGAQVAVALTPAMAAAAAAQIGQPLSPGQQLAIETAAQQAAAKELQEAVAAASAAKALVQQQLQNSCLKALPSTSTVTLRVVAEIAMLLPMLSP